jgi:hypothetical protein
MLKFFILVAAASIIISCNSSIKPNSTDTNNNSFYALEKASWLIGKWQNNSTAGYASETWDKKNDSTYFGQSFFVIGKDTVSSETISLEQNGNQLFYIPTVKDQNDGNPVKFLLTSSKNSQLIFENPTHDFPQKISYTLLSNDTLLAEISGTMDGKPNSQKFPMTRIK